MEDCVKRIVKDQAGVSVKSMKNVYIDSSVQEEDNQWAFVPHAIAETTQIPKKTKEINEVVLFNTKNIPHDFAWWTRKELKEFLQEHT